MNKEEMTDKLEEIVLEFLAEDCQGEPIHMDDDFPDWADAHHEQGVEMLLKFIKEEL